MAVVEESKPGWESTGHPGATLSISSSERAAAESKVLGALVSTNEGKTRGKKNKQQGRRRTASLFSETLWLFISPRVKCRHSRLGSPPLCPLPPPSAPKTSLASARENNILSQFYLFQSSTRNVSQTHRANEHEHAATARRVEWTSGRNMRAGFKSHRYP